jgi:hypothetical protein
MFYRKLAHNSGLPDIACIEGCKLGHVKKLDRYVQCAELYPFRLGASDVEKLNCGNWNLSQHGLLNQSLSKHLKALTSDEQQVKDAQFYVNVAQSELYFKSCPYYQKLASQCGLPAHNKSNNSDVRKLDKLIYCATRYASRKSATVGESKYCNDWHQSDFESNVGLHVASVTKDIPIYQQRVELNQKALHTIFDLQRQSGFFF